MNLRISENQLRFRITREELANLLKGSALELSLPFGTATKCRIQCTNSEQSLALEKTAEALTLTAGRNALETFAAQLPSREGIEQEIRLKETQWQLILEVDVRKSLRP